MKARIFLPSASLAVFVLKGEVARDLIGHLDQDLHFPDIEYYAVTLDRDPLDPSLVISNILGAPSIVVLSSSDFLSSWVEY